MSVQAHTEIATWLNKELPQSAFSGLNLHDILPKLPTYKSIKTITPSLRNLHPHKQKNPRLSPWAK
jgi:hypothetical protein